jgi:hypothetical protein
MSQPIPPVEEANKIAEQNNLANQIPPGANQPEEQAPIPAQTAAATPVTEQPQPQQTNISSQQDQQIMPEVDTAGTIQGLMLQIIALQHNDLLQKKALLARSGIK